MTDLVTSGVALLQHQLQVGYRVGLGVVPTTLKAPLGLIAQSCLVLCRTTTTCMMRQAKSFALGKPVPFGCVDEQKCSTCAEECPQTQVHPESTFEWFAWTPKQDGAKCVLCCLRVLQGGRGRQTFGRRARGVLRAPGTSEGGLGDGLPQRSVRRRAALWHGWRGPLGHLRESVALLPGKRRAATSRGIEDRRRRGMQVGRATATMRCIQHVTTVDDVEVVRGLHVGTHTLAPGVLLAVTKASVDLWPRGWLWRRRRLAPHLHEWQPGCAPPPFCTTCCSAHVWSRPWLPRRGRSE